jgi:murein DD-endopeptidase MepM/ murein hydrolase activator NlpD
MSVHRHAQTLLVACLATALVALAAACAAIAEAARPKRPFEARLIGTAPPLALPVVRRTPARGSGPFHPVRGRVSYGEGDARFGAGRGGRSHDGQDVFASQGTPLLAVRSGVVLEAGGGDARGNYVVIHSPAARETYVYLHMRGPARVRPGRRVRAGQVVGELGCTGSCFGAHLHFEVHRGRGARGAARDPLPLLQRWRRAR